MTTLAYARPRLRRLAESPVTLVSSGNGLSLALGAVQSVVVIRLLGPEQFGVLGIAMAIGGVVANILDLRVADLTTKVMFEAQPDPHASGQHRAASVRVGAVCQTVLAAAIAALTFGATVQFVPVFATRAVSNEAFAALAAANGITLVANYLAFVQRFASRAGAMVAAQTAVAVSRSVIMIGAMVLAPSIEGYAFASAGAALLACLLHARVTGALFPVAASDDAPVLDRRIFRRFLAHRKLLLMTNVLGLSKMLHRGADVLLVGFFCSEYQTGLYKCARAVTDNVSVANDVLLKTYQPRLFRLAAERRAVEYRGEGRRVISGTLAMAGAILAAQLVSLSPLVRLLLGPAFVDAVPAIVLLSTSLVIALGIHVWVWPLLVTFTSLAEYAGLSIASVVIGQYVVGYFAFAGSGGESALPFAVGHATTLVLTSLLAMILVRRRAPAFSTASRQAR